MKLYKETSNFKLFNINCLNYLKSLNNDSLSFTLTSPPYDDIRNYNGYNFDFEPIAKELYRVTKEGGVIVWNIADATIKGSETGTSMRQALFFIECGFRLHDTMIYAKSNPMPTNVNSKRYHQAWEYLFVFSKKVPKTFNPVMVKAKYGHVEANMKHRGKDGIITYKKTKRNSYTKITNILEYKIGGGHTTSDKVAFKHPALMPEQLAEDMIKLWTNAGDLVFDPFAGAGTTAKMSLNNNRRFVGTEISEEFCDVIVNRLENILKLDEIMDVNG